MNLLMRWANPMDGKCEHRSQSLTSRLWSIAQYGPPRLCLTCFSCLRKTFVCLMFAEAKIRQRGGRCSDELKRQRVQTRCLRIIARARVRCPPIHFCRSVEHGYFIVMLKSSAYLQVLGTMFSLCLIP